VLTKPFKSDVKPHNFVLNRAAHVQLIDFGSAAPLVPGSRVIPIEYCRVPCGTCDYISPEILQAHESALVAMEMSDEETDKEEVNIGEGGYRVETDWWSTGAMIYEMAYGVALFFARDIRSTYLKIMDFRTSLMFNMNVSVSSDLRDLLT
jgi:serine/threonine protein kinase